MKRLLSLLAIAALPASASAQTPAPIANHDAPANAALKDTDVEKTSVAASGSNSFTEGQAQERIVKAGFSNVSALTKDDSGLWQGTAKHDGKSVHVALDYKGNVTSK